MASVYPHGEIIPDRKDRHIRFSVYMGINFMSI